MNDLLERYLELDARKRALVAVVAVLLVGAVYWNFVYSGRRAYMNDLIAKNETLRQSRDAKQKLITNLDTVRSAVRDLEAQVHEAEVRLPDQKEIPDLLSSVSSAGRAAGLEIMLFRLKAERYQDFYAEVPVEVLVRGNYHQVAKFFDRVSQLDRIVNVSDISMKTPQAEGDSVIDRHLVLGRDLPLPRRRRARARRARAGGGGEER